MGIIKKSLLVWVLLLSVLPIGAIAGEKYGVKTGGEKTMTLDIQGNLVFYYYKDLAGAVDFYENTLGLKRVLDYGFAKIFQITDSSFIGLVDEKEGMHKSTDPKTVTLSFITDQTDEWFEYFQTKGVQIHYPLKSSSRIHIRGFVAKDPEGYLLEFQKFLSHEMNDVLLAKLDRLKPKKTNISWKDHPLTIKSNISWLYYRNLKEAERFYADNLNLKLLCDQKTSLVMSSSLSGFIGLVDEAHGLHKFSKEKAVNVSFLVEDIQSWYDHLLEKGLKMHRPLVKAEKDRVEAFMTSDVAGYILEFDRFLKHPDNQKILRVLSN